MIQLIALFIIIAGIYFIIRGFTQSSEFPGGFEDKFEEKEGYRDEDVHEDFRKGKRRVKGGGVVLIGPIPIVFGESRYAVAALVLAIVLMLLSFLFMFRGSI